MKFIIDRKSQGFEIIFSEKDIEIIQSKKKLVFDPKNAKDFANNLGAIACEINMNLEESPYSRNTSFPKDEIESS